MDREGGGMVTANKATISLYNGGLHEQNVA